VGSHVHVGNRVLQLPFNSQGDWLLPVDTVATTIDPEKYHQVSQELRVTSPTGGRFEYLAGLYFQTDTLNWAQVFNIPLFNIYPDLFGVPALDAFLPMNVFTPFVTREHVYSAFAHWR